MQTYPGFWAGIVENRIGDDPKEKGRLQIRIPQLHGAATALEKISTADLPWARPCTLFAGKDSGILMLPEVGAAVWIGFNMGDPRLPIWLGCYYGALDNLTEFTSAAKPEPSAFVLKTPLGHKLVMNDTPPPVAETLLESASKLTLKAAAAATLTATAIAMTVTSALSTAFLITAAAGTIQLLSSVVILGVAANAQKLCNKAMMDLFNAHQHTYNLPTHVAGTTLTSAPNTLAAENVHTTSNVRAS